MAIAMAVGISILPLLVLFGLVAGGLVLLIALLVNKKTRPLGLVLLGVGGLGLIVLLLTFFSLARPAVQPPHSQWVADTSVHDASGAANEFFREPVRAIEAEQHLSTAEPAHPSAVVATDSWAKIALLLVGLAVLYGVMRVINSGRGLAPAMVAVVGVVLVAGIYWLRLQSVDRARVEAHRQATQLTFDQAFAQATRARIPLAQSEGVVEENLGPHPDAPKIVANGKETLLKPSADNKELAKAVEAALEDVPDGKKVTLIVDGATMTFDADTPMSAVTRDIDATRDPQAKLQTPAKPQRPGWIDQQPKRIGKVYRQVVEVGPYSTRDECYQNLEAPLIAAGSQFAGRHLPYQPSDHLLRRLGITPGVLMREVCVDEYLETFHSESVGQDMKRLYVQVEFDDAFRNRVVQAYASYKRRDVVELLTLTGVLAFVGLGGVFGLLKLDEATKGFYTKRLFIGVPLAIIGLGLLLGLLA